MTNLLSELSNLKASAIEFDVIGEGTVAAPFDLTGFAVHCFAALGAELSNFMLAAGLGQDKVPVIDRRLATLWFGRSIIPIDWEFPPVWNELSGNYKTQDGWIRLHTNIDRHREAATKVINCNANRPDFEKSVAVRGKYELEAAITESGGVASALRSRSEWQASPMGQALATETVIAIQESHGTANLPRWKGTRLSPLKGLRVLDMTRVLAGPSCTRTLAGLGAEVLRIDPPVWDAPVVVPEVTLGKKCARLNLRDEDNRRTFETLIKEADIFVHGYRATALEDLGYGKAWREENAPHLISATLNAYGWTGPWWSRRGFDSLVQYASGLADHGAKISGAEEPSLLPLPALDFGCGYLMAASVLSSLTHAFETGNARETKTSLARLAESLFLYEKLDGDLDVDTEILGIEVRDVTDEIEINPWGQSRRCRSPISLGETQLTWATPAMHLGTHQACWA